MGDLLIVQSKVKELAKKKKVRMGADAVSELSKTIEQLVDRAAKRAQANRRSTIKAADI
jgi:histone H3/H4